MHLIQLMPPRFYSSSTDLEGEARTSSSQLCMLYVLLHAPNKYRKKCFAPNAQRVEFSRIHLGYICHLCFIRPWSNYPHSTTRWSTWSVEKPGLIIKVANKEIVKPYGKKTLNVMFLKHKERHKKTSNKCPLHLHH